MEFNEKLYSLLIQKRQIDLEIEKLITANYQGKIRFSSKKFVGDLGELYFFQKATIFSELSQSNTSNEKHDFIGQLKPEYMDVFGFTDPIVRIEIKTRHAQVGNNHLKGIDTKKSDLLAFVALDDNFQCRYIGIIKSSDIKVDNQKRIRYSDYHKKGLVKWQTTEWIEL